MPIEHLQSVEQCDGREGVRRRIDDQAVGFVPRLLHPVDQDALMVGLPEGQRYPKRLGKSPAAGFDGRQRRRAVDARLANPEQVKVRSVQNHYSG
jgi:hypothetical protein